MKNLNIKSTKSLQKKILEKGDCYGCKNKKFKKYKSLKNQSSKQTFNVYGGVFIFSYTSWNCSANILFGGG